VTNLNSSFHRWLESKQGNSLTQSRTLFAWKGPDWFAGNPINIACLWRPRKVVMAGHGTLIAALWQMLSYSTTGNRTLASGLMRKHINLRAWDRLLIRAFWEICADFTSGNWIAAWRWVCERIILLAWERILIRAVWKTYTYLAAENGLEITSNFEITPLRTRDNRFSLVNILMEKRNT
jgi:hypothetical protein